MISLISLNLSFRKRSSKFANVCCVRRGTFKQIHHQIKRDWESLEPGYHRLCVLMQRRVRRATNCANPPAHDLCRSCRDSKRIHIWLHVKSFRLNQSRNYINQWSKEKQAELQRRLTAVTQHQQRERERSPYQKAVSVHVMSMICQHVYKI